MSQSWFYLESYFYESVLGATDDPFAVRTDCQTVDLHLVAFELGNAFFGPDVPQFDIRVLGAAYYQILVYFWREFL